MSVERSWQLICDNCGNNSGDRYAIGDFRMSPTKLRRSLRKVGWSFKANRDICEKCAPSLTQAQS